MIMGEDFVLRADLPNDPVPIEIKGGPFEGVVFNFKEIGMKLDEGNSDEGLRIRFSYDIIDPKNYSNRTLQKSPAFREYAGLILNSMLIDAYGENDYVYREDDSSESN